MSDALSRLAKLSPEERAKVLAQLRSKVAPEAAVEQPLVALPRDGRALPAAPVQEQFWFLHQIAPTQPTYTIPFSFTLTGELDVDVLAEIERRHEVLRASLVEVDGKIVQRIAEPQELPALSIVDLSELAQADRPNATIQRPVHVRPGGAGRCDRPAHPRDHRQQPAQPDRYRARRDRAAAHRRAVPAARPDRGHRRGLRIPHLRRRPARAAGVFGWHGEPDAEHLLGRQVVQRDRVEGRPVGQLCAARDLLTDVLTASGWRCFCCQGTYFLQAEATGLGYPDGAELCADLALRGGVVAIPSAAFHAEPGAGTELVRFAFCKSPAVIEAAAQRLAAFAAGRILEEGARL